jgi:hypothetical protein
MNIHGLGSAVLAGVLLLSSGQAFAQHNHGQEASQPPVATPAPEQEREDIFCSTMKTGQLCSHGTAANLRLTGDKEKEWIALARKYNAAVDTATEQLFKDAENVLAPDQLALLKAWFAVGLNPKINQILYESELPALKPHP